MIKNISIPIAIDPVTKKPSVTFTLLILSSLVTLFGFTVNDIIYLYGTYKSITINPMDLTQHIYWNLTMAGLYLGRKVTNKDEKVSENNQ